MYCDIFYYEFVYIILNSIMDSSTFNYAIIMLIWRLHAEIENISENSKHSLSHTSQNFKCFFENANIGESI